MLQNEETLPIVDIDGNVIGSSPRSICHNGYSMLMHPVVHLHLIDRSGRLLLQKRSSLKKIQPGRWDTGVGGHVSFGESIMSALCREVKEEIGLAVSSPPRLLKKYIFSSAVECELIHCFCLRLNEDFRPVISEPDDIDDLRFWTIKDILSGFDLEIFTPNFKQEFRDIVLPYIKHNN